MGAGVNKLKHLLKHEINVCTYVNDLLFFKLINALYLMLPIQFKKWPHIASFENQKTYFFTEIRVTMFCKTSVAVRFQNCVDHV